MANTSPTVPAPRPQRTAAEIKASIEQNRMELAGSLARLKGEFNELADWRKQIDRHQPQVMATAAVAGFVLAGGLAALGSVLTRRRRKRALLNP
jgi:hypothetical protein